MKKILCVFGIIVLWVNLFSSCKKADPTPDANGMVEVEMRRITQMTLVGDTLTTLVVEEKQIEWTDMEDQALKYLDSLGIERILSGGILNTEKYKIKVPAPQPPADPGGT